MLNDVLAWLTPDTRILFILIAGFAMLGMASLPRLLERRPLSIPMIYLLLGATIFLLPLGLPIPSPLSSQFDSYLLEYSTEILVIVSLTAVGIVLDRPVGWHSWASTWRLLAITMPICIIALGLLGYYLLGLSLAGAVLLGGVLAPTDPVLATDVQEDAPNDGDSGEVRFGLTSEAGLNDALAFPFIHLAIALTGITLTREVAANWLMYDVAYRIIVGIVCGLIVGRGLAWFVFQTAEGDDHSNHNEGLVILSATFLAYGVSEIFHGYGFLATFVAAVTKRWFAPEHQYHARTHRFIEQIERIMLAVMLIAFGGIVISGVLNAVTWQIVLIAVMYLLLIRPLAGMLGFLGLHLLSWQEKLAVSFFGIRGMGSLYYLAYGANHGDFQQIETIWAVVAVVILLSILMHGMTATPIMEYLDIHRFTRDHEAQVEPEAHPDEDAKPDNFDEEALEEMEAADDAH